MAQRTSLLISHALVVLLCCGVAIAQDARDRPPNVVVFVVDDLGWADVSPDNPDTFYDTPNVQRIADAGVRFTNGYAACPVCSPSRAALLTGRYPQRCGVTDYIGPGGGNQPENWRRDTVMLPAPYEDRLPPQHPVAAQNARGQTIPPHGVVICRCIGVGFRDRETPGVLSSPKFTIFPRDRRRGRGGSPGGSTEAVCVHDLRA